MGRKVEARASGVASWWVNSTYVRALAFGVGYRYTYRCVCRSMPHGFVGISSIVDL